MQAAAVPPGTGSTAIACGDHVQEAGLDERLQALEMELKPLTSSDEAEDEQRLLVAAMMQLLKSPKEARTHAAIATPNATAPDGARPHSQMLR